MTYEEYREAKAKLDELNRQIDEAPPTSVPVFNGIYKLHTAVSRCERDHPEWRSRLRS